MKTYKEFQFGAIVFIISIPIQILLTILYLAKAGNYPMSPPVFLAPNVIFILIYSLFYGMKTEVDEKSIRISYGIGLIRKTIKLANVKGVSIVSNPWYYGWGIRLIPNGWLYNISGSNGVELTFKDTSRVIRIGSANASALNKAISERINCSSSDLI